MMSQHHAQDRAGRLGLSHAVVTADRRRAAGGTKQRGDDLEERRLAGAVGSQQRDRLAGADVEIDAVEDTPGTEDADETDYADEWYGNHASNLGILAR